MKTRRLRAKYPGRCADCDGPICIGDPIFWKRGAGAQHVDCESAKRVARRRADGCPTCDGFGALANNAPCRACDGTGSRDVYERARVVARESSKRAISPFATGAVWPMTLPSGKGGGA